MNLLSLCMTYLRHLDLMFVIVSVDLLAVVYNLGMSIDDRRHMISDLLIGMQLVYNPIGILN